MDTREFGKLASMLGAYPPLTEEELQEALLQIEHQNEREISFGGHPLLWAVARFMCLAGLCMELLVFFLRLLLFAIACYSHFLPRLPRACAVSSLHAGRNSLECGGVSGLLVRDPNHTVLYIMSLYVSPIRLFFAAEEFWVWWVSEQIEQEVEDATYRMKHAAE